MWRWIALLLLLGAVFVGLRAVHGVQPTPVPLALSTGRVVVVGVSGRYGFSPGDLSVLRAHPGKVAVAAVSVRPRYIGDCAAAGWATLGAGRRTTVGGLCEPSVDRHRVTDWAQRLAAATARSGDAHLGTLAASVPGCVAAVGPGAALAAARPDGTVARYDTVGQFLATGLNTPCPLTLIDPGQQAADAIIGVMAGRSNTTLVVTGVGPPAGSHDPDLQVMYAVGSTPGGWLTSASTRRTGVVNLSDLTRTLIEFAGGGVDGKAPQVDGARLQVNLADVTPVTAQHHLDAVGALSHAVLRSDLALGICGAALLALSLISVVKRKFGFARVVAGWACILPAAMMLTGAVPWSATRSPALFLILVLSGWGIVLTVIALAAARQLNLPIAVVGAGLTVAAFSAEAALGAVMEPGSMLNSRPVNGGRWYGFGNVTFAVYASATLIVLGYLAHRLRNAGRRPTLIVLGLVGFGVVLCEGWPSMGADFGGVLALTPIVVWLVLAFSEVPITWGRLATGSAAAVFIACVISWLDWRRGPAARSHLGAFVQRILDGDAEDIIIRKAAAAAESIITPVGIGSMVLGIAVWIVIFGRLVPMLAGEFSTIHMTAVAALSVAILGTSTNDGGITIWYTITASTTVSLLALWVDREYHAGPSHDQGPPRGIEATMGRLQAPQKLPRSLQPRQSTHG